MPSQFPDFPVWVGTSGNVSFLWTPPPKDGTPLRISTPLRMVSPHRPIPTGMLTFLTGSLDAIIHSCKAGLWTILLEVLTNTITTVLCYWSFWNWSTYWGEKSKAKKCLKSPDTWTYGTIFYTINDQMPNYPHRLAKSDSFNFRLTANSQISSEIRRDIRLKLPPVCPQKGFHGGIYHLWHNWPDAKNG